MKHLKKEESPFTNISPENWYQIIQERMLSSDSTILYFKKIYSNLPKNERHSTRSSLAKLIKFETFLQNKWFQYFEEWAEINHDEMLLNQDSDQNELFQSAATKTDNFI